MGEETSTRKKVWTKQNDSQVAPSDQPGFNIKSQKIKQTAVVWTRATELPEELLSDLLNARNLNVIQIYNYNYKYKVPSQRRALVALFV